MVNWLHRFHESAVRYLTYSESQEMSEREVVQVLTACTDFLSIEVGFIAYGCLAALTFKLKKRPISIDHKLRTNRSPFDWEPCERVLDVFLHISYVRYVSA